MTGNEGTTESKFTTVPNSAGLSRSAVIIVIADDGKARRLTLTD
ncbi:hypothetical protein FHT21_002284 [Pedobacter sp. SG908]|nr:hypothetical protein [Pedobacter sp. SG908]